MWNVSIGQSKEGAAELAVNVEYLMMAERPKHTVINTLPVVCLYRKLC